MNNTQIILCLLGHILGDYYVQTDKLAQLKNEKFIFLIYHGLTYTIPFVIILALTRDPVKLFFVFLTLVGLHFIIDTVKFLWTKMQIKKEIKNRIKNKEWFIYLVDQGVHMITILLVCFYSRESEILPIKGLEEILGFYHLSSIRLLKWILLVFCIYKPTNITFRKMFSAYKPILEDQPSTKKEDIILHTASIETNKKLKYEYRKTMKWKNEDKKAGAIIGFLERALILIFLSLTQYSAIGLILTAKSIARYDMISKSKEFAEYYLIGTLCSLLASVISYYAIIVWL